MHVVGVLPPCTRGWPVGCGWQHSGGGTRETLGFKTGLLALTTYSLCVLGLGAQRPISGASVCKTEVTPYYFEGEKQNKNGKWTQIMTSGHPCANVGRLAVQATSSRSYARPSSIPSFWEQKCRPLFRIPPGCWRKPQPPE